MIVNATDAIKVVSAFWRLPLIGLCRALCKDIVGDCVSHIIDSYKVMTHNVANAQARTSQDKQICNVNTSCTAQLMPSEHSIRV